jgi:hypothetical protein
MIMVEYNPATCVAVPKEELVKLEEVIVRLYDWSTEQGFFEEILSYKDTVRLGDLIITCRNRFGMLSTALIGVNK